ncbi:Hypothetical Protein FCC1311_029852 [Hondaea fermentalgiana]|uniref:Tetraspanin n=1 Tax=Hondaea fermentalgiana TaxID=2315210 RepID=A0A2R5GDN6_9STRA|nr:Hypothetical Protein FCC1311_029852 [Hondaea fermentalgiana]|eukprot:GBG26763.1 Hypothetical Protein FCC1311_029852 [Hondaea fermentalgiana]
MVVSEEDVPRYRSVRSELKSLESEVHGTVSTAVVVISILTGACGAVSLFFAQQVKSDAFYTFAGYVIKVMDQPQYMDQLTFGAFLSSFATFFFSFCLMLVSLFQKRRLAFFFLVMVVVAAILEICGGAIILDYIGNLDESTNGGTVQENNAARQLQDFSIAMYEQCCRLPGHVGPNAAITRLSIEPDDQRSWDNIVTCDEFYSGGYYTSLTDIEKVSESCIGSIAHVQWFEYAVTDYVCSTLNSTIVDVAGETLGTLSIEQLTAPTTLIPIAGEASQPIYGCGGGKIRSFQYMNYVWLLNVCRPAAIALISTGSLAFILGLLACASLGLTSSGEADLNMLLFNSYVEENLHPRHSTQIGSYRVSVDANRLSASQAAQANRLSTGQAAQATRSSQTESARRSIELNRASVGGAVDDAVIVGERI